MNKILVVAAMVDEIKELCRDDSVDVLITGVGKVNATLHLAKRLSQKQYDVVLNLGTCGSRRHGKGLLINCVKFEERDFDATEIDIHRKSVSSTMHSFGLSDDIVTTCGTGDNFSSSDLDKYPVCDMEGYALAKTCSEFGTKFLSIKYVTDSGLGLDFRRSLQYADIALSNFYYAFKQAVRNGN